MENKITKKQHYVPQFYLRQWTDDTDGFYPIKIESKIPPKLKVFNKKSGPSSFCFENYFYAQHTGEKDDISQYLEKEFADIESIFLKELPKLEKKILENQQITSEEKYQLCEFMIFQHFRGKSYRQQSQQMSESLMKQINKFLVQNIDRDPESRQILKEHNVTKEQMIDFAEREEYHIDFGNMYHMAIMQEMYGFCNILHAKYWKVFISRKGEFITTDTPYQDLPTSTHFLGNDFLSREQRFVLSPRVVIIALYPKDQNGKKIKRKDITNNNDIIQFINSSILMNSISFGFHKENKLLVELSKVVELRFIKKQRDDFNNI